MATALIQRFDLMNERGRLADDRRNIKIVADDLESIFDLDASYAISTRDNKPFAFTTKKSRAQVGLSIDLPFNRRQQRNSYRQALIEYQAGRRSLMALEDTIKFEIRSGLRSLEETRLQYPISVTQAALAAEQVISINLQLDLGVSGVRGTDLLLALQELRQGLIAVANQRVGYLVERARFVRNLELMYINDTGFWNDINRPEVQPESHLVYPENAGPAYGTIPSFLFISSEVRNSVKSPLPAVQTTQPRK